MNTKTLGISLLSLFVTANAALADQPTHSVITVEKMHCAACAKKIAAQLYTVRGVKEVRVDVKQKTLFVLPQTGAAVSPRAMWEAVEKAKDTPVRLAGPAGTFTSKPRL